MFLLNVLIVGLMFLEIEAETCELITIPMCKNIGYKMTKVPNHLGHSKQEDAGLELHQYFPLLKVQCSSQLSDLFCAFYAPKCDSDTTNNMISSPLNSRQICQQVKTDCESSLIKYGLEWPEEIDCDDLSDDKKNTEQESWSDNLENANSASQIELRIKYSPSSITFTSCCQVFAYSQKVFFLQNSGDVKVRSADVRSSSVPTVTLKGASSGFKRNGYTTLLLVTGYTDKKEDGGFKPFIYTNWMVTNIRNADFSTGITVREYEGPLPTSTTDNKAFFLLYKHSKSINLTSFGKYNSPEYTRMKMDLDTFVNDNTMVLVASQYMKMDVDEYSRFRSLTENGNPESDVCYNISHYPDSCSVKFDHVLQTVVKK